MDDRIVEFIRGLRAAGVRVSLAESIDALKAVEMLGVGQKGVFRQSLRATLVKESDDFRAFDELFPLFFDTSNALPMSDVTEDMSPEEAQMLAQMMRQFSEHAKAKFA